MKLIFKAVAVRIKAMSISMTDFQTKPILICATATLSFILLLFLSSLFYLYWFHYNPQPRIHYYKHSEEITNTYYYSSKSQKLNNFTPIWNYRVHKLKDGWGVIVWQKIQREEGRKIIVKMSPEIVRYREYRRMYVFKETWEIDLLFFRSGKK